MHEQQREEEENNIDKEHKMFKCDRQYMYEILYCVSVSEIKDIVLCQQKINWVLIIPAPLRRASIAMEMVHLKSLSARFLR